MAYLNPTAGAAREALASVTSDATELNKLDGATLDVAELNILDGVTATAAQINQATVPVLVTATSSGDITLTSTQSRNRITNTFGSTSVMTATLPAAAAGLEYEFFCGTTVQFIVKPAGTDLMPLGTGAFQTTGLGIASLVKGQSIKLVALATGRWWAAAGAGTTGWAAT